MPLVHIETDSPRERELIARLASAYIQAYPAKIRYPVNTLAPLVYPNAVPVAKAGAAVAMLAVLLGVARLIAVRRAATTQAMWASCRKRARDDIARLA